MDYLRRKHGVSLNPTEYNEVFNEEQDKEFNTYRNCTKVSKNELCRILWKQSMEATIDANRKGKTHVRYNPLMIRFAIILRQKLKGPLYKTLSDVFNLPSPRTLNRYDTKDSSSPDGIMYETIRSMRDDQRTFNSTTSEEGTEYSSKVFFSRLGTLSADSMCEKEKVTCNMHTLRFIGFADDALSEDVLTAELNSLEEEQDQNIKEFKLKMKRPPLTNFFLYLFFSHGIRNLCFLSK